MTDDATHSTNSAHGELLGSTLPRLWTRPLVTGPAGPCGCGCALTPATSFGFDVDDFARHVLGTPLDPWERWLVIHAGELLPDGSPRFRHVLAIVARQNGKSFLITVLCLYWLFVERVKMVLSTSTNLDYAREAWQAGVDLALSVDYLTDELPATRNRGVAKSTGRESLTTAERSKWKIAASNRRGGRSLSIDRLVMDELREHDSWEAWSAAVPATNARPGSQVWGVSNQGDDRAVVLDSRRDAALAENDPTHFIAEWSAPDEWKDRVHLASDEELLGALAQSNPNMGLRIHPDVLLGDARAAIAAGGEELSKWLTEILCIRVRTRDPAVDAGKWADLLDPIDLAEHRDRVALCFDVSPDGQHATLAAAALMPDGRVAVDVVASWSGWDATAKLRAALPGHAATVKPRLLGWLPAGPAAAVAADMAERKGWPPRRVTIEEIRGEVTACCMGLADLVRSGQIAHPGDELLTAHVTGAEKLMMGDAWRFTRKGVGHCDAAYALAGAVHLARVMPPPRPPLAIA